MRRTVSVCYYLAYRRCNEVKMNENENNIMRPRTRPLEFGLETTWPGELNTPFTLSSKHWANIEQTLSWLVQLTYVSWLVEPATSCKRGITSLSRSGLYPACLLHFCYMTPVHSLAR